MLPRTLLLSFLLLASALHADTHTWHNQTFESIDTIARKYDLAITWDKKPGRATLSNKFNTIKLNKFKRYALVNGIRVYLGWPATVHKDTLYLSQTDIQQSLAPLMLPFRQQASTPIKRILIDAGHGGKDQGASNTQLKLLEKTMALDLAERLGKELTSLGFQVIQSRTSDTFIPLQTRSALAKKHKADLFISLHFNAVGEASAKKVDGIETYSFTYYKHPSTSRSALHKSDSVKSSANHYDIASHRAAYLVQRQLISALSSPNDKTSDRGVKKARFTVLKDLNCPGILVEGGFITNPKEAQKIATPAHRDKLAKQIAAGVSQYQQLSSKRA